MYEMCNHCHIKLVLQSPLGQQYFKLSPTLCLIFLPQFLINTQTCVIFQYSTFILIILYLTISSFVIELINCFALISFHPLNAYFIRKHIYGMYGSARSFNSIRALNECKCTFRLSSSPRRIVLSSSNYVTVTCNGMHIQYVQSLANMIIILK